MKSNKSLQQSQISSNEAKTKKADEIAFAADEFKKLADKNLKIPVKLYHL
ncbi:hypothetical protein HYT33_01280 [Candidatus Roizmanbacteria bacterium]|nr:hypothetical protein [Candidatus Roizmanbacteria bacterium]